MGASATDMQRELNWPTLASRRTVSEAVAVYQSVSGRGPAYLSALFQQEGVCLQRSAEVEWTSSEYQS